MQNNIVERGLMGAGALLFGLSAVFVHAPHGAAAVGLRALGCLSLAVMAVRRRTLTPWIFVAMVVGAELGFDAPEFAVHLRVFSTSFCD